MSVSLSLESVSSSRRRRTTRLSVTPYEPLVIRWLKETTWFSSRGFTVPPILSERGQACIYPPSLSLSLSIARRSPFHGWARSRGFPLSSVTFGSPSAVTSLSRRGRFPRVAFDAAYHRLLLPRHTLIIMICAIRDVGGIRDFSFLFFFARFNDGGGTLFLLNYYYCVNKYSLSDSRVIRQWCKVLR